MKGRFHRMTMTLNNHYLAIKMLTKAFAVYIKFLGKYMEFYNKYSRPFQDFLSAEFEDISADFTQKRNGTRSDVTHIRHPNIWSTRYKCQIPEKPLSWRIVESNPAKFMVNFNRHWYACRKIMIPSSWEKKVISVSTMRLHHIQDWSYILAENRTHWIYVKFSKNCFCHTFVSL